jgi:Tol biopolymer transport system component
MGDHFPRLFFVDTATGAVSRAIQYSIPLKAEEAAEYTRDGAWVYFWGVPDHQNGVLWRMRSDGSDAARIGPAGDWYDIDASPSPSPDGTRVVYWSNRTHRDSYRPTIRVLTVATGEVVDLPVNGTDPKWSPVGDDILFRHESTLKIMKADGTGERVIGNPTGGYIRPAQWSPDGQWVIAQSGAGLHVINVASGLILRLPASTARYPEVAWRP